MSYYPIFLDLTNKKTLVVGGGLVALRKVETLLNYGASVSLVSRELTPRLKELVEGRRARYVGPEFHEKHLKGIFLVIAATDDAVMNHKVSLRAQERGLLINAVDQPDDCNFIVPSIMRRGDFQVAVSTSGKSPALAKKIRQKMELEFGDEYEKLLLLMGDIRKVILSEGLPQGQNRQLFKKIIESDILEAIANKDRDRIKTILKSILGDRFDRVPILERVLGSEGM